MPDPRRIYARWSITGVFCRMVCCRAWSRSRSICKSQIQRAPEEDAGSPESLACCKAQAWWRVAEKTQKKWKMRSACAASRLGRHGNIYRIGSTRRLGIGRVGAILTIDCDDHLHSLPSPSSVSHTVELVDEHSDFEMHYCWNSNKSSTPLVPTRSLVICNSTHGLRASVFLVA